MNCPRCQTVIEEGTLFCSSCGHALSQKGAPQQKKTLFWSPQASAEQASQDNAPAVSPTPVAAPAPIAAPAPAPAPSYGAPTPGAPPPGAAPAPAPSYGAPTPGAPPPGAAPAPAPAPSYGAPTPGAHAPGAAPAPAPAPSYGAPTPGAHAPGAAPAPAPSYGAPTPGAHAPGAAPAPAPSYGAPTPGAPPPGAAPAPAPSYGAPTPGAHAPGAAPAPAPSYGAPTPGGPYGGAPQSDQPDDRSHPVRLIMPYPEEGSRLQAVFFTVVPFIGLLMMIPHFFWVGLLGMWKGILGMLSFWVILFTGRFPQKWWEFIRKHARYDLRISGYTGVMTLGYPKFSIHDEEYGLDLDIPYPEKSSRLWLFLAFIAIIPVAFVHMFYSIGAGFLSFLGPWAVLFTGRYPQSWFEFIRKVLQHRMRIMCFASWLRNEYPPFGLKD